MAWTEVFNSIVSVLEIVFIVLIIKEIIGIIASIGKAGGSVKKEGSGLDIASDKWGKFRKKREEKRDQNNLRKQEEEEKKLKDAKEADSKLEELGRYLSTVNLDGLQQLKAIKEGINKIKEVVQREDFISIADQLDDKIIEPMLNETKKLSKDFNQFTFQYRSVIAQELNKLRKDINIILTDEQQKLDNYRKKLKEAEDDLEKNTSSGIPTLPPEDINKLERRKTRAQNSIKKQEKILTDIKLIVAKLFSDIQNGDGKIFPSRATTQKIKVDSSNILMNVNNDLKKIKNSIVDLLKNKSDPAARGKHFGEIGLAIQNVDKNIQEIEALEQYITDLNKKYNDEMPKIRNKLNTMLMLTRQSVEDISK